MKKVFIGLGIFLVVLLAAAALVPVLFKDKIKQVVDQEIAKNVNAKVLYEPENISLSIFRNFPNLSLKIDQLTVIGQDSFQRDTLAYLPAFQVGLDLMSVISGEQLKIRSITLDEPRLKLLVLKSGKANWDIFITDTTAAAEADTAASNFSMAIKKWKINNGTIFYEDRTIPFATQLYGVNHQGSGDFTKNVFDMKTNTTAERFTVNYDGTDYLRNKKLDADVTMAMDLDKFLFTFKENTVRVNDFGFDFDGTILMPAEDIDFDVRFKAKETDFKNILSLVPGIYTEQFKDIETTGKIAFNGYVKGIMSETTMPGYGLDLKINDGYFKYPDLPQAARNINVDMTVINPDGVTENMRVDVRKFHLDLGKNPVDAVAKIEGLEPMKLAANLKANIDLAEVTKVFPVEGMTLRGLLKVDADARGTYSETQMPVVKANLNLTNGYAKSKDFPAPVENLNMVSTITNTTGNTDDTQVLIERFSMLLDGEPLEGRVAVQNIDKPIFDAKIKGIIDLTKMTKIFPLEGMTLAGRIKADIETKGKMADIEAGNYAAVKSSGTMSMSNFVYSSPDLAKPVKINSAEAVFNNEKIELKQLDGVAGKSDFKMNGTVTNYMGYLFAENQSLKGNFNLNSNKFDVNEWMVDEATGKTVAAKQPAAATSTEPAEQQAQGVVEVPANIDFVLNANASQVLYDNLKLESMKGRIIIKDKIAKLENMSFNTLGGLFFTNGTYNTQNLQKPKFDFKLKIQELDFKKAFKAFNTIKKLVPVAGAVEGKFSTDINVNGDLGQDMMPVYSTLNGGGLVEIIKAGVKDLKVIDKIANVTKINELKDLVVEHEKLDVQILNGSLLVKPFDVKVGNINMTVGGKNNPDGTLDYATALDVPSGKVGAAVTNQVAAFAGKDLKAAERVTINLKITGNATDPKVSLAGGSMKAQAKDMVKDVVKNQVDVAKNELEARRKAAEDSARAELDRRRKEAEDKARAEIEKKKKETEDNLKKQAEDKLKGIFKR